MQLNTVEFLPKREEFSETLSQKKEKKRNKRERIVSSNVNPTEISGME